MQRYLRKNPHVSGTQDQAAGGHPYTSERTVYRIMVEIGLSYRSNHKPNGITKADRQAQMTEDLLHSDFPADTPLSKCVTDMTEIPACDGKLYTSALVDCYDAGDLELSMDTNMRASLCVQMLDNAMISYPMLRGAILHSDRAASTRVSCIGRQFKSMGFVKA